MFSTNSTVITASTPSNTSNRTWHHTARQTANELVVAITLWMTYRAARALTSESAQTALANASEVIAFEKRLGVFTEQSTQRLALDVPGVIHALNHFYVAVHFPATVALLVWCFARHRPAYPKLRNWIAATTFAALVIHIAYPLAPPRMTTGFVDTLRVHGPNIYPADPARSVANQFAAMPSLHFGWSVIVAATVIVLVRHRARWVALLHPAVTLLAIVATGNHYWLDAAVAGAIVTTAGIALHLRRHRLPRPASHRPPHTTHRPSTSTPRRNVAHEPRNHR